MKQLLLAILMLLAAVPARAEWVFVANGTHEGGRDYVLYADPVTIRREDKHTVSMTDVYDYDQLTPWPMGGNFKSLLHKRDYDCSRNMWRLRLRLVYAGEKGSGTRLFGGKTDPSEADFVWKPVDFHVRDLLKLACTGVN